MGWLESKKTDDGSRGGREIRTLVRGQWDRKNEAATMEDSREDPAKG